MRRILFFLGIFPKGGAVLDGSYSITFDGKNVGKLKVQSQGLMTVFSGDTKYIEGLCRLAVFSEGKAVQIGVLTPSDKGLSLKKSFTKTR